MRILFAGTPPVAADALTRLHDAVRRHPELEFVGVLTRPDAPVGRKRLLTPSPVAATGDELGLPVIKAARVDDPAREAIAALAPDVAVVVAYGALIPPAALELPARGWLNLHFSLLPAYRGAAPVQHAVIDGCTHTGASVFALRAGLDTGPVYATTDTVIGPEDTAGDLLARLTASGTDVLLEVLLGLVDGTARAVEQAGEVTLAPKLVIEDGRLDWTAPAAAVSARSRGVTPEPGAWTTVDGARLKLGPVHVLDDRDDDDGADDDGTDADGGPGSRTPGAVTRVGDRVTVATGAGLVALTTVQPAGKTMMPALDWWRGARGRQGSGEEVRLG